VCVLIKKISVEELFGYYTYDISLECMEEGIAIIHGPNGCGKSTILKMLESISKNKYKIFFTIPFKKFLVQLDGLVLTITKGVDGIEIVSSNKSHERVQMMNDALNSEYFSEEFESNNTMLSKLGAHRIGVRRYLFEDKPYTYAEMLEYFSECNSDPQPDWLINVIKDLSILYIGPDRLTIDNSPKVSKYRIDLINIISSYESQYAIISKQLDATFPNRIITLGKLRKPDQIDESNIVKSLKELSEKRNELTLRSILSGKTTERLIDVEQIKEDDIKNSETVNQVLSIYIEDNYKKFSVLDELLKKINVFEKAINYVFRDKEIKINRETGYVVKSMRGKLAGKEIPITMLSSGEQHFLVLFFELIFNSKKNQLVLIDEPEMSLHISWQLDFVDKLIDISGLNNTQFILASHSPSIIRNHRNISIAVGYEDECD